MLFRPTDGPLLLFYKVGLNPREWWDQVRPLNDPAEFAAIQSMSLLHADQDLQILCRSRQRLIT